MNVSDYLSDDGLALLALCSAFALPEDAAAGGAANGSSAPSARADP